jgi:hypothetical protein
MTIDNTESMQESPESSSTKVFNNIRGLIRDKTRFEPEEVQLASDEEVHQPYGIQVDYQLEANVTTENITGFFLSQDASEKSGAENPTQAAEDEQSERLELAAKQIKETIEKPETKYNLIQPGTVLPYARKHWALFECGGCNGKGRVQCYNCYGTCKETCWNCHGGLYVRCDGYGCYGGKVNCIYCSGTGQVSKVETYQESFWNGSYTEYRTASRTVYVTCTAYGCLYGKTQCIKCSGTAQIRCETCSATGKITCRTCSGRGDLICSTCAGSKEAGTASWVDVNVNPSYALSMPDTCHEDAATAANKEGVHGLPPISELFVYRSAIIEGTPSHNVSVNYDGQFELIKLNVNCGDSLFKLVAYGSDLRWLSIDGVIEHLVEQDLTLLEKTLLECSDDGLSVTRIDHLLEAMKNVVASEVNADALDAELSVKNTDSIAHMMSPEFAARINRSILASLRHIYLRLAKKFWWKLLLATLGVNLLAWAFAGSGWAFISGAITVALGWLFFHHTIATQFSNSMSQTGHGKWLAATAKKSGRSNLGNLLVVLPAALLICALWYVLPNQISRAEHNAFQRNAATATSEKSVIPKDGAWLEGSWTGQGKGENGSSWTMKLDVANNQFRVSYPSLNCSGYWTKKNVDANTASFEEVITNSPEKCTNGELTITRVDEQNLHMKYTATSYQLNSGKRGQYKRSQRPLAEAALIKSAFIP